jgi:nucleotide-binding universal stress UspA family protein
MAGLAEQGHETRSLFEHKRKKRMLRQGILLKWAAVRRSRFGDGFWRALCLPAHEQSPDLRNGRDGSCSTHLCAFQTAPPAILIGIKAVRSPTAQMYEAFCVLTRCRMSYKTIVVNLAADGDAEPIVKLAAEMAHRFDARLVGFAAADVPPLVATGEGLVYEGEVMQVKRQEIERRLSELRDTFEKLVPHSISSEWKQHICGPTRALGLAARSADLIVTADGGEDVFRAVDIGSLVLGSGRPVLVASGNAEHLRSKTVLVAWKDSREARRALSDSLPFLARAREVVVATMDTNSREDVRNSLADVVVFLERHGIVARTEVISEDADGHRLAAFARLIQADLIVSGAYGHSRLREWAFGGVTRSLIGESGINRLLSN